MRGAGHRYSEPFSRALPLQRAHPWRHLTAQQLGEIYYRGSKAEPKAPEPVRPAVTRIVTGNLARVAQAEADDDINESFSKAMNRLPGGASILEFPKGDTADK